MIFVIVAIVSETLRLSEFEIWEFFYSEFFDRQSSNVALFFAVFQPFSGVTVCLFSLR
jgi:hypothetical protein